jgi:hypothetical protein
MQQACLILLLILTSDQLISCSFSLEIHSTPLYHLDTQWLREPIKKPQGSRPANHKAGAVFSFISVALLLTSQSLLPQYLWLPLFTLPPHHCSGSKILYFHSPCLMALLFNGTHLLQLDWSRAAYKVGKDLLGICWFPGHSQVFNYGLSQRCLEDQNQ